MFFVSVALPVILTICIFIFILHGSIVKKLKVIDQKDMPEVAWWKVTGMRSKDGAMLLTLKRIFASSQYQQTVRCVMSQLKDSDHRELMAFREGVETHIRFRKYYVRGSGETAYNLDVELVEKGDRIRSVNVAYLHDEIRARAGQNIGPAFKV